MRFVLNLSSVAAHPTGLGSYATRMADHLVRHYDCTVLAPDHAVLPPGADRVATPGAVAIGAGGSRLSRIVGLARRQAFYARGPVRPDDFVYNPTHHGFLNTRNQVLTIHDLISLHYPQNFPRQARFLRMMMPRLLARSRAVFTVSEFTRSEVLRAFDYPAERVFVVPNALDIVPPPSSPSPAPRDYLLVVGAHLPHKNIEEVLRLAPLWRHRYTLRIVGASGAYGQQLRALAAALGLERCVHFLPFVSDAKLHRLYAEAAALLYPSLVEGFGLPPLEALARGTTPIVSDIPVHREVLGEAALFVRLGDEAAWAGAFAALDAAPHAARVQAREVVLHRYSPDEVGRQLDAALLAVEPRLQTLRR